MFQKGTDQNVILGLQALPSVGETAQLRRHSGGHGGRSTNTCLITLNGSANGLELSILNILNGFGGF